MKTSAFLGDVKAELLEQTTPGEEREWRLSELLLYTRWGISMLWRVLADELPQTISKEATVGVPLGIKQVSTPASMLRILGAAYKENRTVAAPAEAEFSGGWTSGLGSVLVRPLVAPPGESAIWLGTDGNFRSFSSPTWAVVPAPVWISSAMSAYASAWWGVAPSFYECDGTLRVVPWNDVAVTTNSARTANDVSFLGLSSLRFGAEPPSERQVSVLYVPSAPKPNLDSSQGIDDEIELPDEHMWVVREGVIMRCQNRVEALPQLEARFEDMLRTDVLHNSQKRMPTLLQARGPW